MTLFHKRKISDNDFIDSLFFYWFQKLPVEVMPKSMYHKFLIENTFLFSFSFSLGNQYAFKD